MSPTRQTQKTCPWGHVFHVRHVPTSQTPERALVGTFWCSLFPSLVSNTRKCPCGHFLVLAHLPSPSPLSRTPECARTGTFWCSRTSPLPLPCLEHQNEPMWARSDVRAPLPVSTTRTCPHGLVLVLTHLPSPSPSSRTPE